MEYEEEETPFPEIISKCLTGGVPAADIADKCEVSVSTVHRWAEGKTKPLPDLEPYIRCAVLEMLIDRILKEKYGQSD